MRGNSNRMGQRGGVLCEQRQVSIPSSYYQERQ
ncbi:hypothetical protein PVAP13_8KG139100 [Panicum virgatum]|uniref:Uncharacterized protein n=1 Tax=Panicum virgatum TaxID=38727 RepID=A0A8T0PTT0_PANVG|nr:hypothetical protein PVAP13_8KG139100 [Panicum virgatum]